MKQLMGTTYLMESMEKAHRRNSQLEARSALQQTGQLDFWRSCLIVVDGYMYIAGQVREPLYSMVHLFVFVEKLELAI